MNWALKLVVHFQSGVGVSMGLLISGSVPAAADSNISKMMFAKLVLLTVANMHRCPHNTCQLQLITLPREQSVPQKEQPRKRIGQTLRRNITLTNPTLP